MRYPWLVFVLMLVMAGVARADGVIHWQPWSDSVFAQAKREHKFVLLDLQAVWCHWCHVMDDKTYSDPKVIALMNAHYLAVRVDQDSRPDLSNRYEDYGWPATVVFNSDGGEIVKRQGFFPPEEMTSMLQAIIDDPSPGPSVTNARQLHAEGNIFSSDAGVGELRKQFVAGYDFKLGGWGTVHKYLDWDNVECAMTLGANGDEQAAQMAKQTLTAQLKLIDPVWGGVDQYSVQDWDHPHFEKLLQMQAGNLQIDAEAYQQWKDPAYLKAAQRIHDYVGAFLTSPDGTFYTSQDADVVPGQPAEDYYKHDDAGRRKIGIPRVDTHVYARENGWYIQALAAFYAATGDALYRDEAERAAKWIVENRAAAGGGFRHGDDSSRLYLGDTLAMGRAFLSLYTATSDPAWLQRAKSAATFIRANFAATDAGKTPGFVTATREKGDVFAPGPEFDENIALARFANLLFHETGNADDRAMAEKALGYGAAPEIANARNGFVGGLYLAETELKSDPLHIVVVGQKIDPAAQGLYAAALACPGTYKQLAFYEPEDSGASLYPKLGKPAAYVCTGQACSSPAFDQGKLVSLLGHLKPTTTR